MAFFLITCVLGPVVGRKIGWALSKGVLYGGPGVVVGIVCATWGISIAFLVQLSMVHFHPGWVLKVLGYGAGAYMSIPNYGLLLESTIPGNVLPRHRIISRAPLVAFILGAICFAFL